MSLSDKLLLALWRPEDSPKFLSRWVYKKMLKREIAPEYKFNVDFFGIDYQGNFDNQIDMDIFYFGAFEKPMLFFFRDYITLLGSDDTCFVDIGANIGQHTLFMSRLCKQCHAFEPYDKVRYRLERQIEHNNLHNITVHPIGLGELNEKLPYYAPSGTNLGIGSFSDSTLEDGNVLLGELEVVAADDYFQKLDLATQNIMKVDVEWWEKPVLGGMQKVITRYRPLMVVELSYGKTHSFRNFADLCAAFPEDYEFYFFNKRKPDGKKARRVEAQNRKSGRYEIRPFSFQFDFSQDDIIACPREKQALLENLV